MEGRLRVEEGGMEEGREGRKKKWEGEIGKGRREEMRDRQKERKRGKDR